jgi:hypothetical protein
MVFSRRVGGQVYDNLPIPGESKAPYRDAAVLPQKERYFSDRELDVGERRIRRRDGPEGGVKHFRCSEAVLAHHGVDDCADKTLLRRSEIQKGYSAVRGGDSPQPAELTQGGADGRIKLNFTITDTCKCIRHGIRPFRREASMEAEREITRKHANALTE